MEIGTSHLDKLHLKAIFLSDICNSYGTTIKCQIWDGKSTNTTNEYH